MRALKNPSRGFHVSGIVCGRDEACCGGRASLCGSICRFTPRPPTQAATRPVNDGSITELNMILSQLRYGGGRAHDRLRLRRRSGRLRTYEGAKEVAEAEGIPSRSETRCSRSRSRASIACTSVEDAGSGSGSGGGAARDSIGVHSTAMRSLTGTGVPADLKVIALQAGDSANLVAVACSSSGMEPFRRGSCGRESLWMLVQVRVVGLYCQAPQPLA